MSSSGDGKDGTGGGAGDGTGQISGGGSGSAASAALLNQPIVIDTGTSTIKAGFAGGSKPKVVFGTKIGKTKHMRIMPGGALEQEGITTTSQTKSSSKSTTTGGTTAGGGGAATQPGFDLEYTDPTTLYVGRKLDDHRGAFTIHHPLNRGCVIDEPWAWDAMETLWRHAYTELHAKVEEHPVLLTECPLNPRYNRERTAEIFFENFRSPALFFAPPAVLSLYASGRTTGVVLDIGDGVTQAVPVYEGFALPHSIVRSDVGGSDVTENLQYQLRRSGLNLNTTSEREVARTMKERACYVSYDISREERGETGGGAIGGGEATGGGGGTNNPPVEYTLPDGSSIDLGVERYRPPEVLFRPSLMGSEEPGVADVLTQSIAKSDLDLRSTLYESVVLSGGSTLLPGFGDRFLYEVRKRAPERTRIRISAPPERMYSSWVGGSILASLATFKTMWVTREEYEEYGSGILHRRAL